MQSMAIGIAIIHSRPSKESLYFASTSRFTKRPMSRRWCHRISSGEKTKSTKPRRYDIDPSANEEHLNTQTAAWRQATPTAAACLQGVPPACRLKLDPQSRGDGVLVEAAGEFAIVVEIEPRGGADGGGEAHARHRAVTAIIGAGHRERRGGRAHERRRDRPARIEEFMLPAHAYLGRHRADAGRERGRGADAEHGRERVAARRADSERAQAGAFGEGVG